MLALQAVPVAAGLTQGCTPIGPVHTVTSAEEKILLEIDGRPALDVFKEDIGELLARDLNRVAGYNFAGLPVTGSEIGRAHVRTPVTNAHIVCRLLLVKKNKQRKKAVSQ